MYATLIRDGCTCVVRGPSAYFHFCLIDQVRSLEKLARVGEVRTVTRAALSSQVAIDSVSLPFRVEFPAIDIRKAIFQHVQNLCEGRGKNYRKPLHGYFHIFLYLSILLFSYLPENSRAHYAKEEISAKKKRKLCMI